MQMQRLDMRRTILEDVRLHFRSYPPAETQDISVYAYIQQATANSRLWWQGAGALCPPRFLRMSKPPIELC